MSGLSEANPGSTRAAVSPMPPNAAARSALRLVNLRSKAFTPPPLHHQESFLEQIFRNPLAHRPDEQAPKLEDSPRCNRLHHKAAERLIARKSYAAKHNPLMAESLSCRDPKAISSTIAQSSIYPFLAMPNRGHAIESGWRTDSHRQSFRSPRRTARAIIGLALSQSVTVAFRNDVPGETMLGEVPFPIDLPSQNQSRQRPAPPAWLRCHNCKRPRCWWRTLIAMFAIEMLRDLTRLNDGRWRTSRQVGSALDSSSTNPEAIATQARLAGAIFGAWDGEQFWFPAFQFDDEGNPLPQIGELIAALPRDRDGGIGVDAALWLAAPDFAFEGQTPAEYFLHDPERVIRVARARIHGSEAED